MQGLTRRYYRLALFFYVVSYRVTCRANGMALCLYLLCIEREATWLVFHVPLFP